MRAATTGDSLHVRLPTRCSPSVSGWPLPPIHRQQSSHARRTSCVVWPMPRALSRRYGQRSAGQPTSEHWSASMIACEQATAWGRGRPGGEPLAASAWRLRRGRLPGQTWRSMAGRRQAAFAIRTFGWRVCDRRRVAGVRTVWEEPSSGGGVDEAYFSPFLAGRNTRPAGMNWHRRDAKVDEIGRKSARMGPKR
jgi:hypothetical protein